jgi:hypothetical protein
MADKEVAEWTEERNVYPFALFVSIPIGLASSIH